MQKLYKLSEKQINREKLFAIILNIANGKYIYKTRPKYINK